MASALAKTGKRKYSQHDLRRLMQEQKAKSAKLEVSTVQRIDSPLAKYNDAGQLTCVLCATVVRSEDVWKVHVNAKQHKENVQAAKVLKERAMLKTQQTSSATKRPSSDPISAAPAKQLKSILKNTSNPTQPIAAAAASVKSASDEPEPTEEAALAEDGQELPEGFFDDPKKDAIARHIEYKNPAEEEWEKFQKEIREAATVSNEIIAEDQEEATAERQIEEIDEQMRNWNRVVAMEKKKEETLKHLEKFKLRPNSRRKAAVELSDSEDEDMDDGEGDVTEFVDWRAKSVKPFKLQSVKRMSIE